MNVPVAGSEVAVRTTASAPAACTGCSWNAEPATLPTTCVCVTGVALTTTTMPSQRGSRSGAARSSRVIVMTPGVWSGPPIGKPTRCWMRAAEPSRNSGDENRIRSSSAAAADAAAMSAAVGSRSGSASSGCMYGHLAPLSASRGSPDPHVEVAPLQSMRLNQSPES